MNCGTCKHWGTEQDQLIGHIYRQCQAVKDNIDIYEKNNIEPGYEMWTKEEIEESRQEAIDLAKSTKAFAKDGSGYFACLKTAEDFGCILYEQKNG